MLDLNLVMDNVKKFGEYTNWSERKSFTEERSMVKNAVENADESDIRAYLEPLVKYWVNNYRSHIVKNTLTDDELLEAGFEYLNLSVKNYYEKLENEKVGFKFSTYFEWFIRQGIVESIKSTES